MKKYILFALLIILSSCPAFAAPIYVEKQVLVMIEAPQYSNYPTMEAYTKALWDQAEDFASEFDLKVTGVLPEIAKSSGKSILLLISENKSTEELIKELSPHPQVICVEPNYIDIIPEPPTMPTILKVGETKQLTANVTSADLPLTWRSSNESIATVSASGLVTGVSEGAAIITVTTADGGFTGEYTVIVISDKVPYILTIVPSVVSIDVGKTQLLYATIVPLDIIADNVTWSSSNAAIASVDATGLVTGISAGKATITATTEDGSMTGASEITVTVIIPPKLGSSGGGCSAMSFCALCFALMFAFIRIARK